MISRRALIAGAGILASAPNSANKRNFQVAPQCEAGQGIIPRALTLDELSDQTAHALDK